MYYQIPVNPLLTVSECAKFTRDTTWRCADKRNILISVEGGTVCFSMNGEDFRLCAGDFLLIPAGTPYIRSPGNEGDYTFVSTHFTAADPIRLLTESEFSAAMEGIRDELSCRRFSAAGRGTPAEEGNAPPAEDPQSFVILPQQLSAGSAAPRAAEILRRIRREEIVRSRFYNRTASAVSFTELLLLLGGQVIAGYAGAAPDRSRSLPPQLMELLYTIHKNSKRKITLAELAAQISVSEQHVIRLFDRYLDTTPIRYINKVRVFNAIELLRNTDLTVKQIAYELGFDDPNYFCRVFKKEEKMTPLQTRRRIQNFERDHIASPVKK